ncbi:hypothetical protein [Oecophyllibacter saccharovorans]|uniref:Phage holin family protein n=1 Tax=Oecophyllibacter saccharovorans TaxID=2558360 RepID=A0A506ULM0_9PROT|nr:hypothetical protein [Oecophyllibacter saccharovorans]QDH15397.1 hypothetical protein E3E11_05530 [Oecophyllibacter saccharovorans]TPW34229.1 hypothetical protein E3202_06885 [Oecophyllibacter saccharovorans]TPW36416.1 hypothetical protein E3203_01115 [Oecophyllibacter saccharovorans]
MTNLIELAQEACVAQGQVLTLAARRHGVRLALLIAAALFLFFAILSLHGVFWAFFLVVCHMGPLWAALSVLGLDVLIALILGLLALRTRRPTVLEEKSVVTRNQCVQELKQSFAVTTLIALICGPLGRFIGHRALGVLQGFFKHGKRK